ncbi:MAG: UTRA domain-containing protein [Collinsella sp.]
MIDTFDITAFSLYETYGMLGHPVDEAHQKLGIARLDAHDARLLQVEVGSPALLLECLSLDSDGRIIRACPLSQHAAGRWVYVPF